MEKKCTSCVLYNICIMRNTADTLEFRRAMELLTGKYRSKRQIREILAENCEFYRSGLCVDLFRHGDLKSSSGLMSVEKEAGGKNGISE